MIIAIPVNEKNLDTDVCLSFGRTPLFLIYDTDTKSEKYIVNTAANASGGAGIKASQLIVDENVSDVITFHCGENASQVLKPAGVKILKATGKTIKENINAFLNNDLKELTSINPGHHGLKN